MSEEIETQIREVLWDVWRQGTTKETDGMYDFATKIAELYKEQESVAEFNIGKWLSAALDDKEVCAEMKLDIVNWFTFISDRKAKE